MMKSIVVDLDGTLCNIDHRIDWALTKQWDEFHSRLTQDEPNKDVLSFLELVFAADEADSPAQALTIFVTGRPEKYRQDTLAWLAKHLVAPDALLMRPDRDYTPDHELKIKMLEEFLGSKEQALKQVAFVLDDRDKVVEAWRNYGLPCWQVRLGSY